MRINPAVAANVPLDLLRTFVAITRANSLTRAADALGVSPSHARAQMSELEDVLGQPVFERLDRETRLSGYGALFSSYAARMLSINDQLVAQSQCADAEMKLRIGLPRWVMQKDLGEIARGCTEQAGKDRVYLHCEEVEHLARDLGRGLDIIVICNIPNPPGIAVRTWREDVHWVKGTGVTLDPCTPIPVVSWPGSMSDRFIHEALTEAGMEYTVTFTSSELPARMAAVAAGMGVMGITRRTLIPGTEIATAAFLPLLPQTRKAICIRDGLDPCVAEPVVQVLENCLMSMSTNVIAVPFGRGAAPGLHAQR